MGQQRSGTSLVRARHIFLGATQAGNVTKNKWSRGDEVFRVIASGNHRGRGMRKEVESGAMVCHSSHLSNVWVGGKRRVLVWSRPPRCNNNKLPDASYGGVNEDRCCAHKHG